MTLKTVFAATLISGLASAAAAQEVTLRVHHFMSGKATLHTRFLEPWAERLETESDGRIAVELFDSMSLGGRPGDLYDQAVDGAVDVILTLPGYTAGRFNQTEVFELPFIMEDNVATTGAFWDLIESDLQDGEYEDVKVLAGWLHGPGVVHGEEPIESLEDMAGRDTRGPTRLATDLLDELGANPVGMPLPAIPESLSKGVINATLLPWEITPSIRLAELIHNHTELSGDKALYGATLLLAMNWDSYEAMPDDLRAILDAETGKALSQEAAEIMKIADGEGRQIAMDAGNSFVLLDEAEVARWEAAAQPVYDRFIARAEDEGFDGAALIEKAQALIEANQ